MCGALQFLAQVFSLSSLLFCRKWLNIQPVTTNPLKLISSVLCYAAKNKHPTGRRSAFAYWNEETPSRLDLGKSKYGGPFTEEEVEDVKTLFRLLPCVMVSLSCLNITNTAPQVLEKHLKQSYMKNLSHIYCALGPDSNVVNIGYALVILIHICLVFPFYHRHHPSMLKKIGIGCFINCVATTFYLVIDTVGHVASGDSIQCLLNQTSSNVAQQNYIPVNAYILYVPLLLQSVAGLLIAPVIEEFAFAQTPYHLKGIMFGLYFSWFEFSSTIFHTIHEPFYLYENVYPSCGFYYLLTLSVASIVMSVFYSIYAKWYKLRVRQEIYHAHYVVENIFEDEFNRRDEENPLLASDESSEDQLSEDENRANSSEMDFYWKPLSSLPQPRES